VETRQRRQALREAMAPFGRRVSVNVHAAEEMVEQARRYVSDPAVAITYVGAGRLVVSGTVDDASVRDKVRRLGEDLNPTVLVSDKVQVLPRAPKPGDSEADARERAAAWQRLLPAPVVSITADEHGMNHIQLANGNRYYEGAMLRSGAVLTRIGPDGVTVRGGSELPVR
jgi:type III secretion protein D